MASDTFLQIDGIKGESTDTGHKDWIEVLSYSGTAAPTATAAPKPTGTAQHGDLVITKLVDKASPKLHELVSSGKHIPTVTIELMRSTGGKRVKYLTIEMTNVMISGINPNPAPAEKKAPAGKAGTELPTESVSLNYGTIKWTYTQQKRADGTKGGNVAGGRKLR